MERIRVGIIGVGLIGKSHVEAYQKIDAAQIVAVSDLNESEGRRVAEQHGIPNVYGDFREMLRRDDLDAVDVCLHNNLHAPVTIEALRAGKHVYCEKPMAGAYTDARAMLDEARKLGMKLSIQLGTVFSKETRVAKRLIDGGHLGKVYHARSTGHRRRGRPFVDGYGAAPFVKKAVAAGGALYDMGVYHIARLLYLMGTPAVERVSGKVYQEMSMDPGRRESSGFDVEELGVGLVKLAGGVTLDIIEAWAIPLNPFEGSCIVGSKGGLRFDPLTLFTEMEDVDADSRLNVDAADWRWHQLHPDQDAYDSPQRHWIAALQGRVPLLPTAEIALETMRISEGIYLSDRLGREVSGDEVEELSKSTSVRV